MSRLPTQKLAEPAKPPLAPGVRLSRKHAASSVMSDFTPTPVSLQAKLTVNTPGDKYEQEADRAANVVMGIPDRDVASDITRSRPSLLQRKQLKSEQEEPANPQDASPASAISDESENILSGKTSEDGERAQSSDGSWCVRTPFPPGRVRFEGFSDQQLSEFAVIPESGTQLETPKSGRGYDTDGIWFKGRPCGEWFKIPSHCDTEITPSSNEFAFSDCCNWLASKFKGRSRWSQDKHATINPFCRGQANTKEASTAPTPTTLEVTPTAISLQPKLTVNTPGDKYEQEADRVAAQVMRMPEPQLQRQCACGKSTTSGECPECKKKKKNEAASGTLQRVASSPTGGMTAPPIVNDVLSSPGSPLPTGTRSFMESRFGHDFSHVRVHSNTAAVASAREVGARAYTLGSNIVFGAGEYSPGTYNGRALLAHELVHTVQQAERTSSFAPGKYDLGSRSEKHGLVVQRKPEESKGNKAAAWKGTYADEEAIATELMKKQKLSKLDARRKAKEIVQQQRQAIETGYPGLKSGKYSWDVYQDIVIGQDRKQPNCFGDVCKGGKERWEPDPAELNAWLKENKFSSSGCGCKCGEQAVASYVIHLRYTRGASKSVETISQPFHIAEEMEDCTWRSRLGGLGVIFHESPQQLESTLAAESIAKEWAKAASLNFVSAKMELTCYSAKHTRKDYHGPPKGPLKCVKKK